MPRSRTAKLDGASPTYTSRRRLLEQRAARVQRKLLKLTTDARKADARRKIQLGGLVRAAGLDREEIDAATLLGAFLEVARQLTSNADLALKCRRAGLGHIERQQIAKNPDLVAVTVRFPKAPPQAARDEIKAHGLSFTDEREWRGLVPAPAQVQAVALKWGGEFLIRDTADRRAG